MSSDNLVSFCGLEEQDMELAHTSGNTFNCTRDLGNEDQGRLESYLEPWSQKNIQWKGNYCQGHLQLSRESSPKRQHSTKRKKIMSSGYQNKWNWMYPRIKSYEKSRLCDDSIGRSAFKEQLKIITNKNEESIHLETQQFGRLQKPRCSQSSLLKQLHRLEENILSTYQPLLSSTVYRCDYIAGERRNSTKNESKGCNYKGSANLQRILKMKQKMRKKNNSLVVKLKEESLKEAERMRQIEKLQKHPVKKVVVDQVTVATHADIEKARWRIKFRNKEHRNSTNSVVKIHRQPVNNLQQLYTAKRNPPTSASKRQQENEVLVVELR